MTNKNLRARPESRPSARKVRVPFPTAPRPGTPGGLRTAALEIAATLCDEAFWDSARERCNWIGRRDVVDSGPELAPTCAGALGPDLYSGSPGIALFLAEAFRVDPDPRFAEAAAAAIRRAARYLEHDPRNASPLSFHAGHLGVAYAAYRVMDACPGVQLGDEVEWLVARVREAPEMPQHPDVIGGHAGAIPALLWLARRPALEPLAPVAAACGDDICRRAEWDGGACWWNPDEDAGGRSWPLTGFSHGASGIALALLELHARTGHPELLRAARGGFAFEDTLFSESDGNWADTRYPIHRDAEAVRATFQNTWCHGAPGIALARARAAALDPDGAEHHLAMARVAGRTTFAALETRLPLPGGDTTLCHGLSGLTEVLLTAGTLLGEREWLDSATATGADLVHRYGGRGDWPSGVNAGGPNPGLMIGSAGVGYHLLRLCRPRDVPPLLLLLP